MSSHLVGRPTDSHNQLFGAVTTTVHTAARYVLPSDLQIKETMLWTQGSRSMEPFAFCGRTGEADRERICAIDSPACLGDKFAVKDKGDFALTVLTRSAALTQQAVALRLCAQSCWNSCSMQSLALPAPAQLFSPRKSISYPLSKNVKYAVRRQSRLRSGFAYRVGSRARIPQSRAIGVFYSGFEAAVTWSISYHSNLETLYGCTAEMPCNTHVS